MSELYIQSFSMTKYGRGAKPSGHMTLVGDGMSTTITLNEADCDLLQDLAERIFRTRQDDFANKIATANVQLSLGAPNGKTIDGDLPF